LTTEFAGMSLSLKEAALFRIPPDGTPLSEAIHQTVADPTSHSLAAERFVVVFSDGIAGTDYEDAIAHAKQANVRLYPVLLLSNLPEGDDSAHRPARRSNAGSSAGRGRATSGASLWPGAQIAAYLKLGRETGGQIFETRGGAENILPEVMKGMVEHLKADYVVGFYLAHQNDDAAAHGERRACEQGPWGSAGWFSPDGTRGITNPGRQYRRSWRRSATDSTP